MIIFDTNLVSELMREQPKARVMDWITNRDPAAFFTTAITLIEILTGLALLPHGRRRASLRAAADTMFSEDFAGRVLPFDDRAAPYYVDFVTKRARGGAPKPAFDLMIAAIARANGAAVATRNVKDFDGCGIVVHDPWAE